ncbi:hypothetical protein PR202_ga31342 [Eleusine coracana subsp. coracana]|uniref:protein-tyrosine-phosphatase n=1 Tax=Eleusine coracana subsp. coracana TaxID=191504 RepID=A0AAV5DRT0_ELECO|nr:hypothetical protein PR202_ga31342 [Eleusine coracana subsp. coracana]
MFSVTIVVAYLMKKHRMSVESALSLVRSKRPQVGPNEGFMSQLENFEKSLQGKTHTAVIMLLYFICLICVRGS